MASNWLANRLPLNYRRPQSNVFPGEVQPNPPAPTRGIYGDQAVHFSENGRLIYPGQPMTDKDRPTNMLFWRRGGAPAPDTAGPTAVSAGPSNFRYRPWSRTVVSGDEPTSAPIITRRVDRFGAVNSRLYSDELPYAAGRPFGLPLVGGKLTSPAITRPVTTTMAPETVVIEEMRVYDDKPCGWWIYLIAGILMFAVGIANIVVCFEYLYYCYLWTAISLVIFAIVCVIHRGDYIETKWKSWAVIVVGFITTAFVLASTFLVLQSFCHQVIEITQFGTDYYITVQTYRYNFYNITPKVTVNNNYLYNIWICFSLNAFDIALLLISFGVLTTTLLVIDRFYNSYFVINRKVEPFCEPWLFNPWSQCSLGQAMIVVGCVVGSSEHGTRTVYTSWFIQYAPVWAGILPIISGVFAALALKNCGSRRRLVWLAVILELLSLLASVVAIILTILLLADNISTLTSGVVMIITTYGQNLIIASSLLEAISIIVCIINVSYSLSLTFRLLACLCTKWYDSETAPEKQYVLEEKMENPPNERTPIASALPQQQQQFYAPTEFPRFAPYRPMGTRSFYI